MNLLVLQFRTFCSAFCEIPIIFAERESAKESRGGDSHERISLNPCIRLQPNRTNFAHSVGAMIVCTAYFLRVASLKYSRDTKCVLRT